MEKKKKEASKRQYALLWTSSRSYSLMFSLFSPLIFPSRWIFLCHSFHLSCFVASKCKNINEIETQSKERRRRNRNCIIHAIYLGTGQNWSKEEEKSKDLLRKYTKIEQHHSYDVWSMEFELFSSHALTYGWSMHHFNLRPNERRNTVEQLVQSAHIRWDNDMLIWIFGTQMHPHEYIMRKWMDGSRLHIF